MANIFKFFALAFAFISLFGGVPQAAEETAPGVDSDAMLGSMLMLGFRGASLSADDPFLKMVSEGKIGNIILFDRDVSENAPRNVVSPQQLAALTATLRKAAPRPIFIGVDQEGGQVRRLKPQKGFFDLPSAQALGQGSVQTTRETAEKLGSELHGLGINLDLAPVVDVDTNPFNPAIGRLGRAFSSDAQVVAAHALAFGHGLAKNGVVPTLKHFPGQGCAGQDSHLVLPDVSQCWNAEIDLRPYADIFRQGWPGTVMIGHLFHRGLDPDLPSTLSPKIVTGLLRQGLGWQGVVISDDLQMKAVSEGRDLAQTMQLAIEAGVDILLFGNNLEWDAELPQKAWNTLKSLVDEGKISPARLAESRDRIAALHEAYGSAPVAASGNK